MAFNTLVLIVTCFGLTAAATTQQPKQACCVSNKFTATMLELGANLQHNNTDPQFREGFINLDFDYDAKMSKLDSHTRNLQTGNYDNVVVFNDYPNSKLYAVSEGKCSVNPITASGRADMTQPCIPGNFTFERTYRLGAASAGMMVDVFAGTILGERVSIHSESGTCTPVLETLYGQRSLLNDLDITTFLFTDVQQNALSSANPFDLPDACKNTVPVGK